MTQIIKVPDELRGQKIVPLIEWCNQNTNSYENISEYEYNTYLKVKEFKSQPFSVDMLIGDHRLFEGWEYKDGDFYYQGLRTIDSLIHYLVTNSGDSWEFKSLNDFITLCQLAGVDLGVWK